MILRDQYRIETQTQETNNDITNIEEYIMSLIIAEKTSEEATQDGPMTANPGNWFTSKEHYLEFIAAWKNWANRGGHITSSHLILYALLRNRDWNDGWTPATKIGKIDQQKWKVIYAFEAIRSVHNETALLAPFDGTVTTEMLIAIRENLLYYRKGPFGTLRGD